ncbi:hypothetical protein DPMN_171007 [Dreissena polymorpha]|uniref:Uncharacterized protein n=1 Tax=Dreissena polymorpha TaxID=45954 RepID=A0A9D4IES9_DREPO|nr:hypothetical protein DPMN_171007 [Dreissena polymorpha]
MPKEIACFDKRTSFEQEIRTNRFKLFIDVNEFELVTNVLQTSAFSVKFLSGSVRCEFLLGPFALVYLDVASIDVGDSYIGLKGFANSKDQVVGVFTIRFW